MAKWTEAQEKAIYEPSGEGNIFVSAAAGSGKTAVLVERIANMVTEKNVPVDSLLVVTFTEAAAAEMKERIIDRINQSYRDALKSGSARSKYFKEQMHLTANADINTIDSFCMNAVKNNFHILGIDPNFSIIDKKEGEMLMDDTVSEMFMSLYASEDAEDRERFTRLVSTYASNRDDEGLKSIVYKVYNFIQSFPEPLEWLCEKADMYSADMAESVWVREIILKRHVNNIISKHEHFWDELTEQMLSIVSEKCGADFKDESVYEAIGEAADYWGKIWKNVCMCREAVHTLKKAQTWEDFCGFRERYIEKKSFLGNAIKTVPPKKQASDEEWQKFYGEYDHMRDDFREECMILPSESREDFNKSVHSEELKRAVDDIAWLVTLFSEKYEEKKTKRNVKSFSDIEHLTYRLFRDNENIRGEYAQKYEEILIDEYQDTNSLQDAIFTLISRDNKNMFMVGDLKQSIYRFRGGDPTVFKGKSRLYADGKQGKKIMLSQNFRSRREVLESINAVFGAVMSDSVGDVEYDDGEALKRSAERECYIDGKNLENAENRKNGYNSELYKIAVVKESSETDEEITAEAAEAACVADRIGELIDGRFQVSAGGGEYRDIQYRDIVILMRSVKNAGVMRDTLESRGVPVYVQKDEYFERREIKLMLTLISLINNHMQDIPLTAVMRSPIGGFTENELALIRAEHKGGSFYGAVKHYKEDGADMNAKEKRLKDKCRRFFDDLDRWRGYVKTKSIASLIWTLYEETGFYDFMGALEGGEEAQANLKLLYERAKRYEESGFKGIFNFIRYIERMESRSDDISGARLVNESHNVVRIMTIHKSKGLEFPVVFLARTTKRIAAGGSGADGRILLHKDMGIGIDYYNYEDMYCKKLIFNKYIKAEIDAESRSEELRLMYVAMTRAKEKLIVTSAKAYKTREDCEKALDELKEKKSKSRLKFIDAKNAKTYSDWIIPAVSSDGKCWNAYEKIVLSLEHESGAKAQKEDVVIENPEEIRSLVRKILEFKYEYSESGAIPSKTSVTAIKEMEDMEHTHEDDPIYMVRKPKFLQTEKQGAQIGTAQHQIMAYINIEKMRSIDESEYESFAAEEIKRIAAEGQIERDIASDDKIIDMLCANVCAFFRSNMGRQVLNAERVHRERPFEIEISAREYDGGLDSGYDDERIVVQGIIDLYFEDKDGNITLVDYKTDRCSTREEQLAVAARYKKQLELYERAMETILKKSIKNKYLYLFSAQSVVELN
ncbi:MAG: helicase-exonuclease AddAB subunit AddA [Firmicutes bacterium]|nr:helicase-exonuclease AddAB subunit AddA [Bacillota bacterium]